MSDRERLFDDWAPKYDDLMATATGFPFEGYEDALDLVIERASPTPAMSVLEIGVGTGALTRRLVERGVTLFGLDFSEPMLERARRAAPDAMLCKADVLRDWPAPLQRRFDRIVSSYVLHEFEPRVRLDLLGRLERLHLADDGLIVLADIAFEDAAALKAAREVTTGWDDDEYYWDARTSLDSLASIGLRGTFERVSSCAGVFVLERAD